MQKIVQYKCEDGTVFKNELEALRHENEYLRKQLSQNSETVVEKTSIDCHDKFFSLSDMEDNLINSIPLGSGVYMWTNIHDGYKKYVGSAVSLRTRAKSFLSFYSCYAGQNLNEIRKNFNSIKDWTFTILKICPEEELEYWENYFIQELKTRKDGYNVNCAYRNTKDIKTLDKKIKVALATNLPDNIKELYRQFRNKIKASHLYNDVYENLTIDEFYNQIKNFDTIIENPNLTFCYTFAIKVLKNSNPEKHIENLSTVGPRTNRFISHLNKSVVDHNTGIPISIIQYVSAQNCYMYQFDFVQFPTNVPLIQVGFKTAEQAFEAFLIAKRDILKEIAEQEKKLIDKETYNIVNNLTVLEAEKLFFPDKEKYVFEL